MLGYAQTSRAFSRVSKSEISHTKPEFLSLHMMCVCTCTHAYAHMHLQIRVDYWRFPGQVPAVFLTRSQKCFAIISFLTETE